MIQTINTGIRWVPVSLFYILCAVPAPWLFYLGLTGGLGIEPIEALEHRYGELALQFMIAGLAVTPLRKLTGVNLMRLRRAIGVITFFYVLCHLLVWALLDVQIWSEIWADIIKRPYVTVGMLAFVLLLPLALTSNNLSVRRLGPAWRSLHKLVYPAAVLGGLHYVWLAKGFQIEPLAYMAAILLLLASRLPMVRRSRLQASRPDSV